MLLLLLALLLLRLPSAFRSASLGRRGSVPFDGCIRNNPRFLRVAALLSVAGRLAISLARDQVFSHTATSRTAYELTFYPVVTAHI
jgi:hypothetical protein